MQFNAFFEIILWWFRIFFVLLHRNNIKTQKIMNTKKLIISTLMALIAIVAVNAQTTNVVNLTMKESLKGQYYPEKRFAVVIGNADKAKAEHMADSLNILGFDVVKCYGSSALEMKTVLKHLEVFAKDYKVIALYYNGTIAQEGDATYLLPAGVTAQDSAYTTKCITKEAFEEAAKALEPDAVIVLLDKESGLEGSLGNYSKNLYAEGVAKEKAEQQEALAAIAALEAMSEPEPKLTGIRTPEQNYDEAMQQKANNNIENAIEYFKRAANSGHTESMYQLALLYEGRDAVQSMIWMGRASSAGHQKAKEWVAARKKPQQKGNRQGPALPTVKRK